MKKFLIVSFAMDKDLLTSLDDFRHSHNTDMGKVPSRSSLIREAIQMYLDKHETLDNISDSIKYNKEDDQ